MKEKWKIILAVIVTAVVVGAATWGAVMYSIPAAKQMTNLTLMVNYTLAMRHSPFFVGVEKGFYRDEGINLIITPSTGSGVVATAVQGNTVQLGHLSGAVALSYIGHGATFKIIMAYQYKDLTSVTYLSSVVPLGLKTPKDMEGKSFGCDEGSSTWLIMNSIMTKTGANSSKVKRIVGAPPVLITGLFNGQWDTTCTSADTDFPIVQLLAAQKGMTVGQTIFADWPGGYDAIGFVIAASPSLMQSNPGILKNFVRATIKSVQYTIANPTEAVQLMFAANPLLNKDALPLQLQVAIPSFAVPSNYASTIKYGQIPPAMLNSTIYWASVTQGKSFVPPTPDQSYTDAFLPY
jgi:NitT/TauT family transport system substrate-binding protein